MPYNIILSFFTISSIWKCRFLNHTKHLHSITTPSILLALLHYSIHVRFQHLPSLSSTALVVLRGVHRINMNVRCHEVFHNHCVFFANKPASCHWQNYGFRQFCQGSYFQQGLFGSSMPHHWKPHCVCCDFLLKIKNRQFQCSRYIVIHSCCASLTSPFLRIYSTKIFLHISDITISTYLLDQNILAHL